MGRAGDESPKASLMDPAKPNLRPALPSPSPPSPHGRTDTQAPRAPEALSETPRIQVCKATSMGTRACPPTPPPHTHTEYGSGSRVRERPPFSIQETERWRHWGTHRDPGGGGTAPAGWAGMRGAPAAAATGRSAALCRRQRCSPRGSLPGLCARKTGDFRNHPLSPGSPRPTPCRQRRLQPSHARPPPYRAASPRSSVPSPSFFPRGGQRPGRPLSSRTRYGSCGVQDLLHGFDSKPDQLSLTPF